MALGHNWVIRSAINMLAGADNDSPAERRNPVAAHEKLGEVAPAVHRHGQDTQEGEVLHYHSIEVVAWQRRVPSQKGHHHPDRQEFSWGRQPVQAEACPSLS